MTTHYQKILALGTKMAENLTTMGVPSQFSEGGLTLADKILEIRSMSDGIFLFGRDDIIQTGGTARFSGVCLDDSKLVRDTVELFSCDEGSFSNPLTSNTTGFTLIDDSEEITTSSTGTIVSVTYPNALRYTPVLYLGTQSVTIRFKCKIYDEEDIAFAGGLMASSGNMDTYTTLDLGDDYLAFMDETFSLPTGADLDNWTDVKIEYTPSQQKLYINGTLVATATQDLTDVSWYHNYFGITQAQIKDFNLTLDETVHATGSGALTYDYTGVGIGERKFCLRSGGLQSEPYILWDTAFYDSGVEATENTDWITSSGTLSKSFSSNGKTIAPSTSANLMIYANKPSTTGTSAYDWNSPFTIEFDVNAQTDTPILQVYSNDTTGTYNLNLGATGHYKITYDGTTIYGYRDGTEINHFDRNMPNARIGFVVGSGKSLTYKDFMIY